VTIAKDFADLFEGRTDAYGTDEGGCWRVDPVFCSWPSTAAAHLNGDRALGVYPMVLNADRLGLRPNIDITPEWEVKWGCVDFDVHSVNKRCWDYEIEADAHTAALNLQAVLKHFGITSWIERTRSYGRHVWVFADTWVPARTMRRALLVACDVAEVSKREVNPKQEELADGQLGNYVRLPYPGDGGLQYMIDAACRRIPLSVFAFRLPPTSPAKPALATRATHAQLDKLAALYREPERVNIEFTDGHPITLLSMGFLNNDGTSRYQSLLLDMLNEQPEDRSDALMRLAGTAARQLKPVLTPNEVLMLIRIADDRWGKFVNRRDREERLRAIVEKAYQ
jgi:hypothetical protein